MPRTARWSMPSLLLLVAVSARAADPAGKDSEPLRHRASVTALVFAPDGKTLASADEAGTVCLWDVATGLERRRFEGHRTRVSALAFSPDGKTVASGSGDGSLYLWTVASGKRLLALEGHDDWVMSVAFSPDGKTLASGSYDQTARLWDVSSGKVLRVLKGHAEAVSGVSFSPDGHKLATGDYEGALRIWDVASARQVFHARLRKKRMEILGVVYCAAGRTVVSASPMSGLTFWKARRGYADRRIEPAVSAAASLAGSADGKTLIAGTIDGTVHLIEADSGSELIRFAGYQGGGVIDFKVRDGYPTAIRAVALSSAGDLAAAGTKDGQVRIWKIADMLLVNPPTKDELTLADRTALWDDLGGDAVTAAKVVARLAARPDKAVPLLKEKLRSGEIPDRKKILKLIDDLDDETFAVREDATRALEKSLPGTAALLREALRTTESLEVKVRLQRLLEPLEDELSNDRLRLRRALQALERMHTPEAKTLLETLAKNPSGLDLADEAAAALRRRK
jgi:hypothetical protein